MSRRIRAAVARFSCGTGSGAYAVERLFLFELFIIAYTRRAGVLATIIVFVGAELGIITGAIFRAIVFFDVPVLVFAVPSPPTESRALRLSGGSSGGNATVRLVVPIFIRRTFPVRTGANTRFGTFGIFHMQLAAFAMPGTVALLARMRTAGGCGSGSIALGGCGGCRERRFGGRAGGGCTIVAVVVRIDFVAELFGYNRMGLNVAQQPIVIGPGLFQPQFDLFLV